VLVEPSNPAPEIPQTLPDKSRVAKLEHETASLRSEVAELRQQLTDLRRQLE
jgi:hypothetical protein